MKHVSTINDDIITYLLFNPSNNLYKIGRSTEHGFGKRVSNIEVSSGAKISIIHTIASDVEESLHEKFSRNRKYGEWFDLAESDVSFIKTLSGDGNIAQETSFPEIQRILTGVNKRYNPDEIKLIRSKIRLNISQFAQLMSVTKSSATKWESGERNPSGPSMLLMQFVEVLSSENGDSLGSEIKQQLMIGEE